MTELLLNYPLIAALLALGCVTLLLRGAMRRTPARAPAEDASLVQKIDGLLPQTQCGQCGYPGCRPYATAIAAGDAINKCPPGGQRTINRLADLLDVPALPLDADHGEESPVKKVAFIREEDCIGCTKCLQACPVDAIVGAAKQMHTVIVDECTGCDLCVEPCPVDCIDMVPVATGLKEWSWPMPQSRPGTQIIASDRSGPREHAA